MLESPTKRYQLCVMTSISSAKQFIDDDDQ